MITKKGNEIDFSADIYLSQLALPFNVGVDNCTKDYIDIYVSVLCFHFNFTYISRKYIKELNEMIRKIGNDSEEGE